MANPNPKNNQRPDRGRNRKTGNTAGLDAERELTKLAKDLRLAPKTKQLIDLLIDNPKLTQTEAYLMLHDTTRKAARTNASRALASDGAQIYRASHVSAARRRIVQLVKSGNESIALKAAQDILDREHGKPTQKHESKQTVVRVELDLRGVRIGAHYLRPEQRTAEE